MSRTFDPIEADRFLATCGGYRRWELVSKDGVLWWRLASDWGQAHIRGLIVPAGSLLTVDIDLREPTVGGATVALVTHLVPGRLGVDGLPYRVRSSLSVSITPATLSVEGEGVTAPVRVPIPDGLDATVVRLTIVRSDGLATVTLTGPNGENGPNGVSISLTAPLSYAPSCLVFVAGSTNGGPECGVGFGPMTVNGPRSG